MHIYDTLLFTADDGGMKWGTDNMYHIISLYGSAYPSIVAYSSRETVPAIREGLPKINLFFCPGGDGNTPGLKAQMCTGLALTGFPGHAGYLVINDGAWLSADMGFFILAANRDSRVLFHRCLLISLEHACVPH